MAARGQVLGSHVQFSSMSKIAGFSQKTTGAGRAAAASASATRPPATINRAGCDRKNVGSLPAQKLPAQGSTAPLVRRPSIPATAPEDAWGKVGCMNGSVNSGVSRPGLARTLMQAGKGRAANNATVVSRDKTRRKTLSMSARDDGLLHVDSTRRCWDGLSVKDELNQDDHPQVRLIPRLFF